MKSLYKNIPIPATDGKELIAGNPLFTGSPLFSWIDSDFKNWELNKEEDSKAITKFEVLELDKDATFKEIFTQPEKQWMTQSQMLTFIRENKDKLREDRCNTFFLLKKGIDFFVARVSVGSSGLCVGVDRFEDGRVWNADSRPRVVIPQLDSESLILSPLDSLTLEQAIKICKENGLKITREKVIIEEL